MGEVVPLDSRRIQAKNLKTVYSLQRLENMQLKIDKDNFKKFAAFKNIAPGTKVKNGEGHISHIIRTILYKTEANTVGWKRLCELAEYLNVPAELLLDEDYYYKKSGFAGYRALFEAYRQGVSLEELTKCKGLSDYPPTAPYWYMTWYMFFKCIMLDQTNSKYFNRIIKICNEKLGVPLGALISKQLHSANSKSVGLYGDMTEILTSLDERDCVLVLGLIKSLSSYKYSQDPYMLMTDLDLLMGWFLYGNQENE